MATIRREVFQKVQGGQITTGSTPKTTKKTTENVADNVVDKLTERQRVILNIITNDVAVNVAINTVYLSQKLHLDRKTIQRELVGLKNNNLIRWEGANKTGHWEIVRQ